MKGDKIHPATRTFQAIRIRVNDELGEIQSLLKSAGSLLKPGAAGADQLSLAGRQAGEGCVSGCGRDRMSGGVDEEADCGCGAGADAESAVAQREVTGGGKSLGFGKISVDFDAPDMVQC